MKKSRQIPVMIILFEVLTVWMLASGIEKKHFYFDSRFPFPVHIMFWGNILLPAVTLLWSAMWLIRRKVRKRQKKTVAFVKTEGRDDIRPADRQWDILLIGLLLCAFIQTVPTASVPSVQNQYYLSMGTRHEQSVYDVCSGQSAVCYLCGHLSCQYRARGMEGTVAGTQIPKSESVFLRADHHEAVYHE